MIHFISLRYDAALETVALPIFYFSLIPIPQYHNSPSKLQQYDQWNAWQFTQCLQLVQQRNARQHLSYEAVNPWRVLVNLVVNTAYKWANASPGIIKPRARAC